jgi:hypothetical protein
MRIIIKFAKFHNLDENRITKWTIVDFILREVVLDINS